MTRVPSRRPRRRRGVSIVEVLIGLVMFTIGLLALLSGSVMAVRTMQTSQGFAVASVAAQNTLDSLKALGWAALTGQSGSYTSRGHAISWNVTGANPRKIVVVVVRHTLPTTKADSFVTYVAQ